MNEAEAIAENQVKSAVSGDMVTMKSLWENQDCVITFFRRFGCQFCRLAAKQLSEIKPKLDEHNVRLVGIGVEEIGVKEFIDGKFFAGDLFIDVEKKCYKDLQYKRYGILNLIPALFAKTSRDAVSAVSSIFLLIKYLWQFLIE
ncbi:Prostamide/prostaglandin F synthase [Araneus ventricosus]|uniref:Prostamide/prostaglandin F synthase n=1 Tax=Araneus ventricosus TaxID=182803 RepID=A0A4Y2A8W5_ARAVE|nr:Prostamide/prostaglandin F synthase [Araneus ventricosus]